MTDPVRKGTGRILIAGLVCAVLAAAYGGGDPADGAVSVPATTTAAPLKMSAQDIVTEAQFNQMFPNRNPFYTYAGLTEAFNAFPHFAATGDTTARLQEAAAFLANVTHETGGLQYIIELNQANWPLYCASSAQYPCAPGRQYYGRGPLQLSWNYNYQNAGAAFGVDLVNNPDLVAQDAAVAWKTALWFWMTMAGAGTMTGHDAMVNGHGFGETIRSINGALECGKPADSLAYQKMQVRVTHYTNFTQLLGVGTGSNLTC